jgi:hypothetical protein
MNNDTQVWIDFPGTSASAAEVEALQRIAERNGLVAIDLMDSSDFLWARPLGEDRFEVRSVPWNWVGIDVGDVVLAPPRSGSSRPCYEHTVEKGGHATFRVIFAEAEHRRLLSELLALGARRVHTAVLIPAHHGADASRFVAIDVPPTSDQEGVRKVLRRWFDLGLLDEFDPM